MEKEGFRVVIKHYFLRGNNVNETKEKFAKYCSSYSTGKYWNADFKRSRSGTKDKHVGAAPKTVIIPEIIEEIHNMLFDELKMKIREIAEVIGTSTGLVIVKWVLCLLTIVQRNVFALLNIV